MVKLPELNQARVNKCLIALVNRKIVRKDSTSVRPPFKVVWCEFMLNSYRVVCCIFGMAWRHSIVDSSILPLPISVLDICTFVSIFLFSCIRCINIPQILTPQLLYIYAYARFNTIRHVYGTVLVMALLGNRSRPDCIAKIMENFFHTGDIRMGEAVLYIKSSS